MRIIVLDGVTLNPGDNPWSGLGKLGELSVYERTQPDAVVPRAAEADVLVINKVRLTEEIFRQLPQLKLVAVTATGFDCVDVQAAREHNVVVSNVPVYGTDSVAQHIFALLLHVIHRVDVHDAAIRDGQWKANGNFSFWRSPLVELSGKSLGIVGYGRIGRAVGRIALAFGLHLLVHTRSDPGRLPQGAERVGQDRLWAESDVISLNCPLTDETKGLVNADRLRAISRHAILVNAGRGGLVVEQDLADALNNDQLAAACLDVVSQEPINDDNPLLRAKNCFLTPHMAWAALEARRRLMQVTVDNVRGFLQGRPQNVVS